MALLDTVFGTPNLEADPLARPDTNEATDLPLHVRQCALRYGALRRDTISIQRWLLVLVIVLLVSNSIDVKALIQTLLH